MAGRLENKIALVTGASTGIGRATAVLFAEEGAHVVIGDVNDPGGEETLAMIRETGQDGVFVHTDVSRVSDVQRLINKTIESFGRLDCAFNNAGILGARANTAEYDEDNWDKIMDINLKGIFLCMKYEIPQMLTGGSGSIVNTSSLFGLIGTEGCSAYVASKHGVAGLTKTAALEYAQQGIRVNAVCPGTTRTPMYDSVVDGDPNVEAEFVALEPTGRLADPQEIAEAVLWLSCDAASFVTGHTLSVDGGRTAR